MIKIVRNQEGDSIARADIHDGAVSLSVGVGAYQLTDLTPEQARELALNLMVLAAQIKEQEQ
jgi:hypothetical protein